MFDVPARKPLGEHLGELLRVELGQRSVEDDEADARVLLTRQIAGLPKVAGVLVVPILHADAREAAAGERAEHVAQRVDQRMTGERERAGEALDAPGERP